MIYCMHYRVDKDDDGRITEEEVKEVTSLYQINYSI